MERSKLKLAVIFLLAVLNLCLLGSVVIQNRQSRLYEDMARTEAVVYLKNNGIAVQEETIPWKSSLSLQSRKAAEQILDGSEVPEEGAVRTCEIQTQRQPETLVVDFVAGLSEAEASCTAISRITEGYQYSSEGTRAVLTPTWRIETDGGTFLLDCAAGELTQLY